MAIKELNLGIHSINGYRIECYPATLSTILKFDGIRYSIGVKRLYVLEGIELYLEYTAIFTDKITDISLALENGLLTRLMGLVDAMCCSSHRSECLESVNSELVVLGIEPMQFADVERITKYIQSYSFNDQVKHLIGTEYGKE